MLRPVNNRFSTKINIYLHNRLESDWFYFLPGEGIPGNAVGNILDAED